ncbi:MULTISPECIES: adenylate/guanylate cyclase domain-containing protein [Thalassospira]|uniref:Adenylate/guanylate cyclase domain-containing protein n=1 Tax=Thalassospira aquimaris TaxID=3037796 RepID=A0ABT6G6X1_9PROT|nr:MULTISPECIES: adenylate/guanylate cyclase domain-containing protein [Thalassospira]MDG4717793.1 adenylate/guanylate cyclase domain-containing protein [Thalassospira sp. FZY0004]
MRSTLGAFLFGNKAQNHLPERVQAAIDQQQHDSEKLIGWIQLLLVTIFASLYAISPSTSLSDAIKPVPWALGLYYLFTLKRLALAYRNALTDWFLTLSVIADIGLLLVLIWSFHIQYMQPASFYLKAPTMMYVFIFIALRSLRFDPRYILIAGATAALGWLVLASYAIWSEGGKSMITRDYVTYLTSNAILIGAEIDKIIAIVLVTLVLAIAVMRAKRSFIRAVTDEIAARDLSRFVSPEIANRITHAEQQIKPGDGDAVIATVMFTDIEGFSSIAETLTPKELATMLNEYFTETNAVISRFGGVITQYQGDGMLITFNAVTPDTDHALSAVRTALAIQDVSENRIYGFGGKLKTRCGINTGEIMTGAVGSENRLTLTVHGDNVNIAARLETMNKQFNSYILASEATVKACGHHYDIPDWISRGEVTVRGRQSATPVFGITRNRNGSDHPDKSIDQDLAAGTTIARNFNE